MRRLGKRRSLLLGILSAQRGGGELPWRDAGADADHVCSCLELGAYRHRVDVWHHGRRRALLLGKQPSWTKRARDEELVLGPGAGFGRAALETGGVGGAYHLRH